VEAVILYPSLGMPMVLGPEQKVCSLIIATKKRAFKIKENKRKRGGVLGMLQIHKTEKDVWEEAEDAPEYIDRHLRLTAMNQPKGPCAKSTERGELCGDGTRYNFARKAIRVWRLGSIKDGMVIANRHSQVENGKRKAYPLAVLAWGLTTKGGPYAGLKELWEVEIDLKGSGLESLITDQEFLNWAWLVKTTDAHKNSSRDYGEYHEPQDRMIHTYLEKLVADRKTPRGRHYDAMQLYEVDLPKDKAEYPMPQAIAEEAKRLQSWHPVIKATHLPLKLAHLTDPHINVRQGALAKSPACVIEGVSKEPVGRKVAHTFWSVKALIEQMAAKRPKKDGMDTALLLTGDYLDFNRNIDPRKVESGIGGQWKQFNVLAKADDDTLYRRGFDDTLMYSQVREAYTEYKLPVFMVSGNHEGYQLPYGISPRKGSLLDWDWPIELGARELMRILSTEEHKRELEAASKWVEDKATAEIAAEHNLTFYEATLAYGPTYGQVCTTNNFKKEQFDWFHMLFTPFSDAVLFLGANADQNGGGTKQILALLGWGEDENYKNLGDLFPLGGLDAQGAGVLPRAPRSFSEAQMSLLAWASTIKGKKDIPFVLGTHFTLVSYHPQTPLKNKDNPETLFKDETGLTHETRLTPTNGAIGLTLGRLTESAMNEANWGTGEKNQREFYGRFVLGGEAGQVDWHISGHSHRAGVYQVREEKQVTYDMTGSYMRGGHMPVNYTSEPWQGIRIELPSRVWVTLADDPGLSKKIDWAEGTRFVVSSSAGPIGIQNMRGEFDCWQLRPPSGSWIDLEKKTVEQIKAPHKESEKPRLCVMLDYLAVMNPGRKIVPIRFSRLGALHHAASWKDIQPFTERISFRISKEMARLGCLRLEDMKIWVFKGKETEGGDSGDWLELEVGKGISRKKEIWDKEESKTEWFLDLQKAGVVEKLKSCLENTPPEEEPADKDSAEWAEWKNAREPLGRSSRAKYFMPYKRVLQAFCEIPLAVPEIAGKEDLNCGDPWIFPLVIGVLKMDDTISKTSGFWCYLRRPFGEKGEVPDWYFRAKYFERLGKGYIPAEEAINNTPKKKSSGGGSKKTGSPYGT
jgi:predicted MPP superfamily phosphohydrolase